MALAGLNLAGPIPAGRPATSGPDDAWRSGGGHGRGMAAGELLGSGAFSLALGAAAGDKEGGKQGEPGFDPAAARWGIWGRGDYGSFAGRPGEGSRYTGAARTAWFGADARGASGRWVAGLAVSSGTSETDYDLEDETGRLETDLTALWPYGRWTFANGLELRGLAGAGSGWVRYFPEGDAPVERSRLTMRAASLGVRRAFLPLGGFGHGIDLAARADASLARMHTGKGDEEEEKAVDGLRADVWRLSGGLEASRRFPPRDGAAVTPFTELAARRDGGDGPAGTGIELAGGVRVAAPGVSVEARGRWLAAHTEAGAEERGVSLTARLGPGAHGRGLSMSLAPRWGATAGGPLGETGALWREELPRGAATAQEAGGFEGELGYGMPAFGGRFTGTPNVGFGASDGGGREVRIGWRLTPAVPGYPGFGSISTPRGGKRRTAANPPPTAPCSPAPSGGRGILNHPHPDSWMPRTSQGGLGDPNEYTAQTRPSMAGGSLEGGALPGQPDHKWPGHPHFCSTDPLTLTLSP